MRGETPIWDPPVFFTGFWPGGLPFVFVFRFRWPVGVTQLRADFHRFFVDPERDHIISHHPIPKTPPPKTNIPQRRLKQSWFSQASRMRTDAIACHIKANEYLSSFYLKIMEENITKCKCDWIWAGTNRRTIRTSLNLFILFSQIKLQVDQFWRKA